MLNFNNQYKLYNLSEAMHRYNLSLDDFDDEEEEAQEQPVLLTKKVQNYDILDEFIESRILNQDDTPLKPYEQNLIDAINNSDTYINKVKVSDRETLINVLNTAVKYFGWEGNYNWIDTSEVTSFMNLFQSAFGNNKSQFNGDISKWDTHNVKNMLNVFEGCSSLKCDISNWDVSNVQLWNSQSYMGTCTEFKKICKTFERNNRMPKWVLRIR